MAMTLPVMLIANLLQAGDMRTVCKMIHSGKARILSRSSTNASDPLSDVLTVLGARVTRCTRLEAAGAWGLDFPAVDRLKFVAVLKGTSWILLPARAPQLMNPGDVCLIGRTPYAVASDPERPLQDGRAVYDGDDVARLGGDDTIALGGTVTFSPGNADFLLDMLPDFLLVPRASAGSAVVATILALLGAEAERGTMGNRVVSARLADVLLVEAIRAHAADGETVETGWLGALRDPRLGRVLQAIHGNIAHPWTVAGLAGVAGMSRAAFAAAFTRRVGQPPLNYLRAWRLTLARAALARGDADIARLASSVGYTSQSAFTHAFRSAFGTTPKAATRG
jgi:AraC-like DNA-binding protein